MMRYYIFSLFLLSYSIGHGQWVGIYEGQINGDNVKVDITNQANNKIEGVMSDSYQKFNITGDINGNRMAGDAVEQTWGLKVAILGEIKGNTIDFKLVTSILGVKSETPFTVTKQSKTNQKNAASSTSANTANLAKGTSRDPKVVGRWTKNESYNSGYGDNFMGANFSQSFILYADGGVEDGGSNASVSGSNYYGKSSDGGASNAIPGLIWYTKDSQLFFSYTQDGKTQSESLGKYYVENNKMLITLANGKKILLSR